jgi:hypothetical protein
MFCSNSRFFFVGRPNVVGDFLAMRANAGTKKKSLFLSSPPDDTHPSPPKYQNIENNLSNYTVGVEKNEDGDVNSGDQPTPRRSQRCWKR